VVTAWLLLLCSLRGYPQFSFWILVALAEICFFHIVVTCAKMLLY